MKKKVIRLTEGDLHRIVKESVKRALKESQYNSAIDDFYSEEDSMGNQGEVGMVKSYEIGYDSVSNFEYEAEEEGMSLEEYIKYWWDEISSDGVPFEWQRLGSGYGFNGTTILRDGNVVFKDIYGQLIIDEYPPQA